MILACQNINKSFGTTEILKDVSFHLEEREKAALIGPNGAGKTTLLRIIMQEMPADSGEVILARGKTIGYLAQHQELSEGRTIYEELLSVKQYLLDMEEKIRENNVKLFLLCSPHNPVGRVWTRKELTAAAEICSRYQVIVAADEIHCDFVRPGFVHTPYGTLPEELVKKSVICTAPSKTFNLAGLQASNIIIPDETLRRQFLGELNACASFGAGMFGLEACRIAYETGEEWLEELLLYLEGNYQYVRNFLKEQLPGIRLIQPEGTYLIWMDFRSLGYSDEQLKEKMRYEAKLWLDEGTMFGAEGSGFMRMNIAAPRSTIEEAMRRLKAAFSQEQPG